MNSTLPYAWDWLFIEHGRGISEDLDPELLGALYRYGVLVAPGMAAEDVRQLCAGLCDEQITG